MEFVLVVEDQPDAQIARDLADRVLHAEPPDWLRMGEIRAMRTWTGLEAGSGYTKWTDVKHLAKNYDVGPIGHRRSGEPGGIDFAQGRKAILLHEKLTRSRNSPALLLIRDMDTQPERRLGLEQAREEPKSGSLVIVIGAARPKREAWVLNGFEPKSEEEERRLQQERRTLPVDPLTESHMLTASSDQAQNSCKRVVRVLTGGDADRERMCWQTADLGTLRERGTETGLADFLREVEDRLLPLLDPSQ
jgi:hypothetical protein